jgi:hypothetical protein
MKVRLNEMDVMESATAMQTITNALVSGFTSIVNDIMTGIGNVLPVVLPVFGALMLIGIILSLVKKFKKG